MLQKLFAKNLATALAAHCMSTFIQLLSLSRFTKNRNSMTPQSVLLDHLCISEEDIVNFRDNNPGLCGVDMSRVSRLLVAQLSSARKHRVFNSFSVTDVLQRIEGVGRVDGYVKSEEPFRHSPLKGFWKAHFFDAGFLRRNLINHWGIAYEECPRFNALLSQVESDEEQNPSPHGWHGRIAHEFVVRGYKARAKNRKMTGEWIIFAKFNGTNYYLGLAGHSKSKDEDEALYAQVKAYCSFEFPLLFAVTSLDTG